MAISQSSFSKALLARDNAIRALRELAADKALPPELAAEAKAVRGRFEAFDMEKLRPRGKALEGKILTLKEAVALVVAATGLKRWKGRVADEDEARSSEDLEERYGVALPEGSLASYVIERETSSKSAVWCVELSCAPGHVHLSVATERVQYGPEAMLPNAKVAKYLRDNVEV